ncbi:MAG: hypothetical protein IJQ62_04425 [Clostridia bacterium]|nr:hypothetical protein [Clostridia bacterium]
MDKDLTSMTQLMYDYATASHLTLKEAKVKLHADAYLRTAAETLARYCGVSISNPDVLRKKVTGLLCESDPSAKKDSVDRKVRNWINDGIQYISKDSALQLAFALHLPINDADEMLQRLCGERFHWRDPEDIIWLFALDHGMSYSDARALSDRLLPVYEQRAEEAAPPSKEDAKVPEKMTSNIMPRVMQIQEEKELEAFLKENAPNLGKLHNTAFGLFQDYMNLLKSSHMEDMLPDERKMPASEIAVTYLFNNLIPRAKKSKKGPSMCQLVKDVIQKDIQQNWPDEFALSRMENREIDVSRKALILLFLATDGGDSAYGNDGGYFQYEDESDAYPSTPEAVFADVNRRLNDMLIGSGFPPLDSRVPFDWMMLYCMVADDSIFIDENISRFLSSVFSAPPVQKDE